MKNNQNEKYQDLTGSVKVFRFFMRKQYPNVPLTNEQIDSMRLEFGKYLHDKNFTESQKKRIVPKSDIDVMMNADTPRPLRFNGFYPAYVLHFNNWMNDVLSEIEEENS